MGGVKKYFKNQFQLEMFTMEHDNASDFYTSCWQKNRSILPIFWLRIFIFSGCVSILVSSMVLTMRVLSAGMWFIFLTHWGLILNTCASGLALAVSFRVSFKGPIDGSLGMPWLLKAYWIMYNIAIPIAFLITIFYWVLLTELGEDYAMNPTLDIFIHGANSLLMLLLAMVSRHPTRLLHFYWSLAFAVIYMIFTIIFHFAGGISPFGESWIYPQLDWAQPAIAVITVVGSAVGLIIMHFLLVGLTLCRDYFAKKICGNNVLDISNDGYN